MNSREKQLMRDVPLMQCGNKLEFQQRLQWLSEGMLASHLLHQSQARPDPAEIEQYRQWKASAMTTYDVLVVSLSRSY
jgi:hypothetical protein